MERERESAKAEALGSWGVGNGHHRVGSVWEKQRTERLRNPWHLS